MSDSDKGFPPGDEHDRRDSHVELWRAINLTREKMHSDAKIVGEIQFRVGKLEDWKDDQDREVLAHGKELAAINVHLGNIARAEERRVVDDRESRRQTLAVIALIMTGISIASSVIMYFIVRAMGKEERRATSLENRARVVCARGGVDPRGGGMHHLGAGEEGR